MSKAIIMIYIDITEFVLLSSLEKDHNMIETRRLKNVVIFIQTLFISALDISLSLLVNLNLPNTKM